MNTSTMTQPSGPTPGVAETSSLAERLQFMRMTPESCAAIRSLKPIIDRELPIALDKFYEQIRETPHTAKFFESKDHVAGAKHAQTKHWENISNGDFNADYARNVKMIGTVHARIGLEPRWYIGGYAVVLEHLIASAVEAAFP